MPVTARCIYGSRLGHRMKLSPGIVSFFGRQSYVIFSTIDEEGRPHSVAKGIIDIDEEGTVYLLDLYRGRTYANLLGSANASVTAIDEHEFAGFTLKGRASVIELEALDTDVRERWRRLLRSRITGRIIKNIQAEIRGATPHEAHLPEPEYVIAFEVGEVVDLAHGRRQGSPDV